MNESRPSIQTIDELPNRVLCVATSAADAILGCGGVLAMHAARGDAVRVLVVADSDGDEPSRSLRESEARAAAAQLGVHDVKVLGLDDGGGSADLAGRLGQALGEFGPELLYAPSPFEPDPGAVAVCRALVSATRTTSEVTLLLFGVRCQVPANVLIDVTGERTEAFVRIEADRLAEFVRHVAQLARTIRGSSGESGTSMVTAVISTWNKRDDVRANLDGLLAQTMPFASIVVVDNASEDGTGEMIARDYPSVRLIVMPHSRYGACETFNIGFASVTTELTAILDDDVILPPDWLEKTVNRLQREPPTTAIVSTKIIEPGMPESYLRSPAINTERYMSTFRGCASLARTQALSEAGGYDERFFIYGNERDLTCRLLNLGYRVLQFPDAVAHHKTPFGIKLGKRSLYYHARNAWLGMLKYAPLSDLLKMPFIVLGHVVLRTEAEEHAGQVSDATGTIGIGRSLRQTPGAWWVLVRAGFSVLYNVPYCLKRRDPVHSPDFELPIR
ncbi:MAG: glycosyltransferase [Planctomycetota bacterium]|nr:MAG: glycosyltransferase [Planctomycetota bacterium]